MTQRQTSPCPRTDVGLAENGTEFQVGFASARRAPPSGRWMGGVAPLRRRKDRRPAVPSVVVSGMATEEEAGQCLRLGALDVLRKPVSLDRLEATLDVPQGQALGWRGPRG